MNLRKSAQSADSRFVSLASPRPCLTPSPSPIRLERVASNLPRRSGEGEDRRRCWCWFTDWQGASVRCAGPCGRPPLHTKRRRARSDAPCPAKEKRAPLLARSLTILTMELAVRTPERPALFRRERRRGLRLSAKRH